MKKYTEITNVSFQNKGDQLMVEAVIQAFNRLNIGNDFSVPLKQAQPDILNHYGFLQTLRVSPNAVSSVPDPNFKFDRFRKHLNFIPLFYLKNRGVITPKYIRAVIDISGFAYSDFWGLDRAKVLLSYYMDCKAKGQKVILMPKTFGPFKNHSIAGVTREIIKIADLVFCRDQRSFDFLKGIEADLTHVHQAPDYTGMVQGSLPEYASAYKDRAVIIPNFRMIDKTESEVAEAYPSFLAGAYRYFAKKGARPFILLHQATVDKPMVSALKKLTGEQPDVVIETDPLYIKGIIGQCSAVLSSRLHGIINGLSLGVPTLGTGWAHKYEMVFRDYDCPELLIRDIRKTTDVEEKLESLFQENFIRDIKSKLGFAQLQINEKNEKMWEIIRQNLVDEH